MLCYIMLCYEITIRCTTASDYYFCRRVRKTLQAVLAAVKNMNVCL